MYTTQLLIPLLVLELFMLYPYLFFCPLPRVMVVFATVLLLIFVVPAVSISIAADVSANVSAEIDALEPLELHITTNESEPLVDEKGINRFQKYIAKLQGSLNAANANFEQGKYKKSGKLFADAAAQIEKSDKPDYLKLFAIHYSAAYSYYLNGNMATTIFHINKALDDLGQYRGRGQGGLPSIEEEEGDIVKGVRRAEMEAYYILGDSLIAQGESNQGQQALRTAIDIADEIGEEPFARSVNWRLYQEQAAYGKQKEALVTLNKSLEYYQRDKNNFMIATTLYQKGVILLDNNQYSASYRSFSNAISIAKNHGYLELLGRSYMGLSESSLGIGSYYTAALNLENAIDIVVSAEMSDVYLPSSRKLINIYRLIGEYEKALYISDKRVQFAIERQNTTLEAQIYVEKGDTYRFINDLHNATLLYSAAVSTIKQAQAANKGSNDENSRTLGDTYYKLATAYAEIGDNTNTEIYALEAAVTLDELDDQRATEVYALLGDTYMELNLYAQAANAFETALKRSDRYKQINKHPYLYKRLGLSYKARGDVKNSIALLESSINLSQDYKAMTALGALYTLDGRISDGTNTLAKAVDYYNTTTNKEMQSNSRYNYAIAELKGGNYGDAMANLRVAHNIDIAQKNKVKIAQDLYTKGAIQYYTGMFADSITNANSATAIVEQLMGDSNATVADGYKTMIRQIQHLKIASAIKNNDPATALKAGEYLNLIDLPQGYANFNLKTLQKSLNNSEIMLAILPADVDTQDGYLDTAVISVTRSNIDGRIVSIPLDQTKGGTKLKTNVDVMLKEQISSPTPYRFDYPYTDVLDGAKIINNQQHKSNSIFLYKQLIQPYQDALMLANKVIWFYSVSIYSQIDFELLQNNSGTILAQQNRIVYAPAISPIGNMPTYVANRKTLNKTIVIATKGVTNKGKKINIANVSTYLNALEEATLSSPATNYLDTKISLGSIYEALTLKQNSDNHKILPPKTTIKGLNRYVPSQRLAAIVAKDGIIDDDANITVLTSFENITEADTYPFINTVVLNPCQEFNGGGLLSYVETTEDNTNNINNNKKPQQHFMRYNELSGLALGGNTVVMPNCSDTPNFRLNMGNARSIPIALYFAQTSVMLRNIGKANENSRIFLYQYMYEVFQEGQNGIDALHTVQKRYMNGALGENMTDPKYWNKFRVYANIYR